MHAIDADMPQQQLQAGDLSPPPTRPAARLPPAAACRVRFDRPYLHPLRLPGQEGETKLTIHQARFKEQGFASTGERTGAWVAAASAHTLLTHTRDAQAQAHCFLSASPY